MAGGDLPIHQVWEDEKHLAFLTIYPNTPGFTVVIPKQHYSSYAFDLPDTVLTDLVLAARTVGKLIDMKLPDVGRTGMIFEGFGVDHVHAKLFPMHGTKMDAWKPIHSSRDEFYFQYPGYISSHDGLRADDKELEKIAREIRE